MKSHSVLGEVVTLFPWYFFSYPFSRFHFLLTASSGSWMLAISVATLIYLSFLPHFPLFWLYFNVMLKFFSSCWGTFSRGILEAKNVAASCWVVADWLLILISIICFCCTHTCKVGTPKLLIWNNFHKYGTVLSVWEGQFPALVVEIFLAAPYGNFEQSDCSGLLPDCRGTRCLQFLRLRLSYLASSLRL